MTARYMLDTNICIYVSREKPPQVLERFERLSPGEAVISVVTWGELRYGAEKSNQRDQVVELLNEFSAIVPVAPLPDTAGESYGEIRAALEVEGTPIGNNDLWIAAHALAAGVTLVSHNRSELDRVPGLSLETWAS